MKSIRAMTKEQVTEAAMTWANFNGFSGEQCGKCKKTANVLAGGQGWFCNCGHYNYQGFSNFSTPHKTPDIGTNQATITEGFKEATQIRIKLRLEKHCLTCTWANRDKSCAKNNLEYLHQVKCALHEPKGE